MTANGARWTWLHAATLVVALGVLAYVSRGQWFFGDEWDFIVFRGLTGAADGLLFPHNEHWSTIPILVYRALFSGFGTKSYWPYMATLFAFHLAVVHVVWRLAGRVGVPLPVATAAAAVMALYGSGSENILWAFQIGFVGSLLAGLALCLLVDENPSPRRVLGVAAGNVASLMFSGISVVMVGVVGLLALRRWGWKRALVVTVPAAAVYLVWLVWQGNTGIDEGSTLHGSLGDMPRYVFGGLSATFGRPLRSDTAGDVVLVALAVVTAVNLRRWWRAKPEALAAAAGAPVMFAVISQGRGAIADPAAPRYLYLAFAMMLPLLALSAWTVVRRVPFAAVALVVLAAALAVSGVDQLRDAARVERERELALQGQYFAAIRLGNTGAPIVEEQVDTRFAPRVRIRDFAAVLGSGAGRRLNARDRAGAELAVQVAFHEPTPDTAAVGGALAALPAGARRTPHGGGCDTVDLAGQTLAVRLDTAARFSVAADRDTELSVFVPYRGGNAGPRIVRLAPGQRLVARRAVPGILVLQAVGPVEYCGVTWETGT